MHRVHKRLDFSFTIPGLIDRDRVDQQLYSGTFTYSGPGCGLRRGAKQQIR